MSETDLLWMFLQAVPREMPHVLAFRRNIIRGATIGKSQSRISNGIPGQADAYAVARGGKHVELETKSVAKQLEPKQRAWRDRCEQLEIPHLVLRANKGEAPEATVARWVDELAHALGK